MKIMITEAQYNRLNELSSKSNGVKEYIEMVKSTKGLLKHLGFKNIKALEEYITDNGIKEFYELIEDATDFIKKSEEK
jgi:hypothetical protein